MERCESISLSGAATTAAEEGIEDATINMLGRLRSRAYHRYIKMPREKLASVSCRLAKRRDS